MRTAIANSAAASVGELVARGKLLDAMEFTDDEREAIGWRLAKTENGDEVPLFRADAVIARNLSEKQVARLRAIVIEMVPTFRVQVHDHVLSALGKLGWAPTEDDE